MRETKYELKCNTEAIKSKEDVIEGCAINAIDSDPELVEVFDSHWDATAALAECQTEVYKKGEYWYVTEYWLEKCIYEDDEFYDFVSDEGNTEMPDESKWI